MAYATRDDLEARYGSEEIARLLCDDAEDDAEDAAARLAACQSQSKMGPCRGVKMGHFG